jgi:dihydrofolate reductase
MARLIYSAITSLDGYIEDANGNFDWGEPDEEAHSFINERTRSVGTYLFGRRLYEVMVAWERLGTPDHPAHIQEFARIWQDQDKVVYSSTLEIVTTARTRLERKFDPGTVRQMKDSANRDLAIGGAVLAARGFEAGLVDECHLYVCPIIVGGGRRALPDNVRLELELTDERRFGNGMVFLNYRSI